MVVTELNVERVTVHESEADAPLVVDGDGELAFPIPTERVQLVARREAQVAQAPCTMQHVQLSLSPSGDIRRNPTDGACHEQFFGAVIRE